MPDADASLDDHLRAWLGAWPPPVPGRVWVIASDVRFTAGWDGVVRPVLGVLDADGGGVISVRPGMQEGVVDGGSGARSLAEVSALIGVRLWDAAFRWCSSLADVAPLPDTGSWVNADDPRLPDWLRPFNGGVLALFDEAGSGEYLAGVGIKRHDEWGQELSVGTAPAAQGRGLARALVATAARRVLRDGAVATYLHDFNNVASAKVADAAGFPDRRWRVVGSP